MLKYYVKNYYIPKGRGKNMKRQIEKLQKQDSCGHISYDAMSIDPDKNRLLINTNFNSEIENRHLTPEQLLMRQAIKYLTAKQRAIWEYYSYDRFTQDEIAEKLHMKQQNVSSSIKAIEKRIAKWVKSNMGAYKLLKSDLGEKG